MRGVVDRHIPVGLVEPAGALIRSVTSCTSVGRVVVVSFDGRLDFREEQTKLALLRFGKRVADDGPLPTVK